MHILIPIGSLYPSQQGGPSNTMYWLAEGLGQAGHQVTAISTNILLPAEVKRDTWIQTAFGKVRYCSIRNPQWCLPLIWQSLLQWRRADLVHLNSLYHFPSFFLANLAALTGKKLTWSPRGNLLDAALKYNPGPKQWINRWIRIFLARKAVFHSTSPEESASIRAILGPKARILEIPNGMKLPEPLPRDRQAESILYLGRIHPIKALENLLDAYAALSATQRERYPLRIAGDGEASYIKDLKARAQALGIAGEVQWMGVLRGEVKEQALADARLLALPSHSENFGNVVIEALAHGTAVIASKGTPWQSLESEGLGRWPDNSAESLQQALSAILDMPETEYFAMRARCRSYCLAHYDIHAHIPLWDQYFSS